MLLPAATSPYAGKQLRIERPRDYAPMPESVLNELRAGKILGNTSVAPDGKDEEVRERWRGRAARVLFLLGGRRAAREESGERHATP